MSVPFFSFLCVFLDVIGCVQDGMAIDSFVYVFLNSNIWVWSLHWPQAGLRQSPHPHPGIFWETWDGLGGITHCLLACTKTRPRGPAGNPRPCCPLVSVRAGIEHAGLCHDTNWHMREPDLGVRYCRGFLGYHLGYCTLSPML